MDKDNETLPVPEQLTLEQTEHWERTLKRAEKLRDTALRMLGRLPEELG